MVIGSDIEQGFPKIAREAVSMQPTKTFCIYMVLEDKNGKSRGVSAAREKCMRSGAGVGVEDGRGNMN